MQLKRVGIGRAARLHVGSPATANANAQIHHFAACAVCLVWPVLFDCIFSVFLKMRLSKSTHFTAVDCCIFVYDIHEDDDPFLADIINV